MTSFLDLIVDDRRDSILELLTRRKRMKIEYKYQDTQPIGYATDGSAGIDLRAIAVHGYDYSTFDLGHDLQSTNALTGKKAYSEVRIGLNIETIYTIDTGVRVAIPKGYVGLLQVRSSMGAKGMVISSGTGVIDSDYRGNLLAKVWVRNRIEFNQFDRILQLVIVPVLTPLLEFDDNFDTTDTVRGVGGYGSTNVNN